LLGRLHAFFERDVLALEEAPDRPVANDHAAGLEFVAKLCKRQIRCFFDALQNPGPLAGEQRAVVTAYRLGGDAACRPEALNPADDRADPYVEDFRRLPPRQPAFDRRNNTLPQVLRIGLRHPLLASLLVASLNHDLPGFGNPQIRFAQVG
jgi:hypothetical protein